ncbi:MAG: 6-phosphogluconolactonase, partial [Nitrospinaceae bacterium]
MNSDTHRRIRVFDSAPALAEAAAAAFLEAARQARESGTRLHVALSGGSTPRALFRLLGGSRYATNIPWAAVHLYWA